ncbi:uncharacterized protein L199_007752 [Kwoniella botswanensis]|uniref:uncharacterized protein n=1 Tax=Kwoniella botswanensis TaxID=1268659 RepID=UPI00315C6CD5
MSPEGTSKYSESYNDESANITLTSSDDVLFKVNSYEMKTHSSVLRDILSDPNLKSSTIPIDPDSSVLILFLDNMTKYPPPLVSSWKMAESLFSLADKYDCRIVHETLKFRLGHVTMIAPWEVFCFASHENDLDLARKALEKMGQDFRRNEMTLTDMSAKDILEPTAPYLVGLLDQLGTNRTVTRNTRSHRNDVNWEIMAKYFTPRL